MSREHPALLLSPGFSHPVSYLYRPGFPFLRYFDSNDFAGFFQFFRFVAGFNRAYIIFNKLARNILLEKFFALYIFCYKIFQSSGSPASRIVIERHISTFVGNQIERLLPSVSLALSCT